MIDLYEFLVAFGLPQHSAVKMYRHVDPPATTIRQLIDKGDIDLFQAVQTSRQLGSDLVLFFAGEAGRMSRFIGGRRVVRAVPFADARGADVEAAIAKGFLVPGTIWHELDHIASLEPLANRLTIRWPGEGRHHLWLRRPGVSGSVGIRQHPVYSVRALGFDRQFPGFDDLLLSALELKRLSQEGDGETGWITALSSTRGAYLITDTGSGELYVGSATGEQSFWGRWQNYAYSIHGGNKILKERCKADPSFGSRLQYSILETISNLASQEEGLAVEVRWKRKLGKRATALNAN